MLDIKLLLRSHPRDLPSYFKEILKTYPEREISAELFTAIHDELLPPTVSSAWLPISQSFETVHRALEQSFSVHLRSFAIQRFGKLIRRPGNDWPEAWKGIGDTQGIVELLGGFSIVHIKEFLWIFRDSINGSQEEEKRAKVTELLQALIKSPDNRPLLRYYSFLIPACTSQYIQELLDDDESPLLQHKKFRHALLTYMLKLQPGILRTQCYDEVFGTKESPHGLHLKEYLPSLFQNTPKAPHSEAGFSESMFFSLEFLRRVAAHPELEVKQISIVKTLIRPLLRRAYKRRIDPAKILAILDQSLAYISGHPKNTDGSPWEAGSFLYYCILFWAHFPAQRSHFETRLVSGLEAIRPDISNLYAVLQWVNIKLRYPLLKIIFLHSNDTSINLDDLPTSKSSLRKIPTSLTVEAFLKLDKDSGLALLRKLRSVGCEDLVAFTDAQSEYTKNLDSAILISILEKGEAGALERTIGNIEENKKKASKGKDQVERINYSTKSLCFAVASGSLKVYRETLKWANRFIRDHNTAKAIFGSEIINNEHAIRLLSGVPPDDELIKVPKPLDLHSIHQDVIKGNKIVLALFETVCLALKEPSFHQDNWVGPLKLMGDVICKRLDLSILLQHDYQVSDDQLFDVLWVDTLTVAIEIENRGLQPGYEALLHNTAWGSFIRTAWPWEEWLSDEYNDVVPELPSSTYRFIEAFAEKRDKLWTEHRQMVYPSVAALPSPFPRGLSIQNLAGPFINFISRPSAHGKTPSLFARAEAIVFPDPSAFSPIPEDEETRQAVGQFVDSFYSALQIYVEQSPTETIRKERITLAWNNALTNLSSGMTQEEARRLWQHRFKSCLGFHKLLPTEIADLEPKQTMEYPVFPFDNEVGDFAEWNPLDGFKKVPSVESRLIEPPRCFDCSLDTLLDHAPYFCNSDDCSPDDTRENITVSSPFIVPKQKTLAFQASKPDLWSLERMKKSQARTPAIREGLVVSALQYLELRLKPTEYFLARPFPSEANVRYPNVWLDESSMDSSKIEIDGPLGVLKQLLDTVPPTFLLRVAQKGVDSLLEKSSSPHTERVAFGLLILLASSDRPQLASKLVLDAVTRLPGSSSWHRKLVSPSFLKSLSAGQAEDFIQSFSDAVREFQKAKSRTEETAETDKPVSDENESASPFIKITTIKYLAQILHSPVFVPHTFAAKVLAEIFEGSNHGDVQGAIVDSLLETLCTTPEHDESAPLLEQLFNSLEATIPIVSRFNESDPLEDLTEAEKTGVLPAPYGDGSPIERMNTSSSLDTWLPPILKALMQDKEDTGYLSFSETKRDQFIERVLRPILKGSIASNTRWLEIFTAKHGLDFHSLNLPLMPVKPKFLSDIMATFDPPPRDLIRLFHGWIMMNVSPPPEIEALNFKLETDPEFSSSIEAKHWLSLYGHKDSVCSYEGFEFASLPNELPLDDFSPTLQDYVFEQAKALLYINPIPCGFEEIMDAVSLAFQPDAEDLKDWQEKEKPILDRIIKLLDDLRTPEWQRDRNRKPSSLPSTLEYRIHNLPYIIEPDATDADLETVVDIWKGIIAEIAKPGLPYHNDLNIVVKQVTGFLHVELEHRVACIMGRIHDNMTLPDFLTIQIAAKLFENAERDYVWDDDNACWEGEGYEGGGRCRVWRWRKNSLETGREVVKTLNNWEVCEHEWIRDKLTFEMERARCHYIETYPTLKEEGLSRPLMNRWLTDPDS